MKRRWLWLLLAGIAVITLVSVWWRPPLVSVAEGSLLRIDLSGEYVDAPSNPVLARLFGRRQSSLLGLLSELKKVERDPRIETVLFDMSGISAGWGKAEEIRSAIRRLDEVGKKTVAYLELETLGANLDYWIASAAGEIVLAPASRSALLGLASEYLFLGGALEKIGIEIEYERIGRYKSAVEAYGESKMSDANREMSNALLDSVDGRFVAGIAEGRGLSEDEVRAAIDVGPTTPEQLLELGLADQIAFYDEWLEEAGDPPVIEGSSYAAVDPSALGFGVEAQMAIVYGSGAVVTGSGDVTRGGDRVLAADTVAGAILEAAEDPDIEAILFRVDSPGGSPLASDIVWRAIARAREMGKPVVASFSDVAASGGYYVACGADKIVANATSITGSIGVFVLRPVLGGLLDKLGVGVETLTRGQRADLLLGSEPLSPGAREVLEKDVRRIYDLFVSRVAEGRGLEVEAVDAVARGRVWTGEQALDNGLIDAVGGLRTAIREAKILIGLDPGADVLILQYPPPRPLAEQLAEAFGLGVRASQPELPLPSGVRRWLRTVEALPLGAPLLIPPFLTEIH
ncbi:MAG: signal peptide peptidase SppA [Myxococcota bacterium]|nr:signal peptide peptidase SppA [Myxococcota bacterium]